MYLYRGKIFWHEVPNRGQPGSKRRPLVILSPTADANNPQVPSVVCVACSHSAAERDPLPTQCVRLPEKVGKRQTKLGQTTAAVCD
jgi:mRNA-degrading endonuclease toxin of MazEF toxin-antitoxin module